MWRLTKYQPNEVHVVPRLVQRSLLHCLLEINSANLCSKVLCFSQENVKLSHKVQRLLFVWWCLCTKWVGSPCCSPSRRFCHPFGLRVVLPGPSLLSMELTVFLSLQAGSLQVWSSAVSPSGSLVTSNLLRRISSVPSAVGNESDAVVFVCCVLLGLRVCWETSLSVQPLVRSTNGCGSAVDCLLTLLGEMSHLPCQSGGSKTRSRTCLLAIGSKRVLQVAQSVVCCVGRFNPFIQSFQTLASSFFGSLAFRVVLTTLLELVSVPLPSEFSVPSTTTFPLENFYDGSKPAFVGCSTLR